MGQFTAKLDELFGMDIRALALMRIGFSLVILLQCFDHLPYVKAFYADNGVFPISYATQNWDLWRLCLNLINGSWEFQMFLMVLLAIAAFALMVGYKTRLCTFIVWILLCSFHNRNWMVLGAEDKLLHILFFWLMFVPWEACYSIDNGGCRRSIVPLRVSSMGTTAYLIQIGIFYGFAGLLKFMPTWTIHGTALPLVLSSKQFAKPFGESLLQYPSLLTPLSFAAVYLERLSPLFLFFPFKTITVRLAVLAALLCFHVGIFLCLEVRYFQLICLIMLIGFLPTAFLNKFLPVPAHADRAEQLPSRATWKLGLIYMPPYLSIALALLIVYVLCWNISDLNNYMRGKYQKRPVISSQLDWIGHALNLRQHWGMYGPTPFIDDGWFVLPGKLRNGNTVDIFKDGAPVTWAEPQSVIELNRHYSWSLYYMNIHAGLGKKNLRPWGEYVCREWNAAHTADESLEHLDIIFMQRDLVLYRIPPARKVPLMQISCADVPAR